MTTTANATATNTSAAVVFDHHDDEHNGEASATCVDNPCEIDGRVPFNGSCFRLGDGNVCGDGEAAAASTPAASSYPSVATANQEDVEMIPSANTGGSGSVAVLAVDPVLLRVIFFNF